MEILIDSLVHDAIGMRDAIEALRHGYARHDEPDHCPARTLIRIDEKKATFGVMPYYSRRENLFIAKIISHHAQNVSQGRKSINGVIVVQDGCTGQVLAQLDASTITALRTGATAGLATDLLARKHSKKLAIIGTGDQAMAALSAVLCVRDIDCVSVYSRNKENVERFIVRAADQYPSDVAFLGCEEVRSAIEEADIVCTATTCAEPLFSACDVVKGVHVNALGKHTLVSREFPLELVPQAILVVEDRESAIREAGNYHSQSISISEILQGPYQERQSKTTIFSSVGTAFQDACICIALLKKLKLIES